MSKYLAVLNLNDAVLSDPDQNINELPAVSYVEEELGWVEESGITVETVKEISDDSPYKKYMEYLIDWVSEHSDDEDSSLSPLSYDEWKASDSQYCRVVAVWCNMEQFISAMNYPYNSDIMLVSIDRSGSPDDDHFKLIGYMSGSHILSVLEPASCCLDSYLKDMINEGDIWDYISMFKANRTTFTHDEDATGLKAIEYLKNSCLALHDSSAKKKVERFVIVFDPDEIANLPDGLYVIGIKH